jgi:hypothetical protein
MMGGKNYHHMMLPPMVKELCETVTYAAKGNDKQLVDKYFRQYV